MDSAVLIILIFSALWTLALGASRQYYANEANVNWEEAHRQCRENYTDLATIENEEDMDAVKDLLNGKTGKFWIGLKQNMTYWKISGNRSWFWSDGAPFNYTYWDYREPNNVNEMSNCVEVYTGKNTWNDANCKLSNSFVCYKKRPPVTVITQKKTWREALRFCRQNHVDLLYIYSQEMQDWVEYATKNVTTALWIGLRHTCALGFWYWVSGETICYQNWASGNGTGVEDCNGVERTGALLGESKKKWVSLPQTQELNFICINF